MTQIRYIKTTQNTTKSWVDKPEIIKSCFDFCEDRVRLRVKMWLDSDSRSVTLRFRQVKVRLEKV